MHLKNIHHNKWLHLSKAHKGSVAFRLHIRMGETEFDLHGMTVGAGDGGCRIPEKAAVFSVTTRIEAVNNSPIDEIRERLASHEDISANESTAQQWCAEGHLSTEADRSRFHACQLRTRK